MTYEIYRYIFLGSAVLCGIMVAVSIVLFFVLRIPSVIGDLTGLTAKKGIENIRNKNESTGEKVYKSSTVNRERGRITDKISPSGRIDRAYTDSIGGAMSTEKLSTEQLSGDTDVLGGNETSVLTEELASGGETALLSELDATGNTEQLSQQATVGASVFEIEYEIEYVHSDEIVSAEVL
ncbi:MAG: hypothetical protein IJP16_04865 [Clostridia bacterium]|nr:hypothetical protein [Clostridia bacterium]